MIPIHQVTVQNANPQALATNVLCREDSGRCEEGESSQILDPKSFQSAGKEHESKIENASPNGASLSAGAVRVCR